MSEEEEKIINDKLSIAKNPNSKEETLISLADDKSVYVREYLAKNPNCPTFVLDKLADDQVDSVRQAVASNLNCSYEALKKLSKDSNFWVTLNVINNIKTPSDILESMIDKNLDTAKMNNRAIAKLSVWRDGLDKVFMKIACNSKDENVLRILASNPICPVDALEYLSKTSEREYVFDNPRCPLYILEAHAEESKESYYLLGIAKDPKCSIDKLQRLSESSFFNVRLTVAKNPNSSLDIIENDKVRRTAEREYERRTRYNKFRNIAGGVKTEKTPKQELIEIKNRIEEKKKESDNTRELIFENLKKVKKLYDTLDSTEVKIRRLTIPNSELLVKVNDHYEIKKEYLEFIPIINLSMVSSDGLKACGIDFSESNISLNPQTVWKKDLSYSKFNNRNFLFKSFKGCNLCGSDLSDAVDSYDFEYAIIDSDTKLPVKLGRNM